jgi:hypothetical protein
MGRSTTDLSGLAPRPARFRADQDLGRDSETVMKALDHPETQTAPSARPSAMGTQGSNHVD